MNLKPKPRVTEIIREIGLGKDFSGVDPFYRDRGTACHKAIELYLKGQLDDSSIDESYQGHFQGFLKFWGDYKQKEFETEVHLETDIFQGTLDLYMDHTIWDYKCSKAHDRVAEIQGAGYKKLWLVNRSELPYFCVVQLPGNGSYSVEKYVSSIGLWDSVIEIYKWKKRI